MLKFLTSALGISRLWQRYALEQKARTLLFSTMIGNALEWYDFILYGYFVTIIGKVVFPPGQDPLTLLLKSYAIFFLGFLMRPLGGLLFGYIGDRWGRKKALTLSIYCMAIPTACLGLIPSYTQAGIWSAILLTVLKLWQGLSMGGEFTGSMIFTVEQAPQDQKSFWGSFATLSVLIGLFVGSCFSMALGALLSPEALEGWGWRVPFLFGAAGSWVAFYIRKHIQERTPEGQGASEKKDGQKKQGFLKILFKDYAKNMFNIFLLDIGVGVGFFMVCIYIMSHVQQCSHLSYTLAATINTGCMVVFALSICISGLLSDRYGALPIVNMGFITMGLFALPGFWLLSLGSESLGWICCAQGILAWTMGMIFGPLPWILVHAFPHSVRYSGVSLAHNLSMTLFGGSAPEISTYLVQHTGWSLAPGLLLACACLISWMALSRLSLYPTFSHE